MPTERLYRPTEAAALVQISPSSLRVWCSTFSEFLSTSANPGAGSERVLSPRDIAILQRVKELRDNNTAYAAISETLRNEDIGELQPHIDLQPTITVLEAPEAHLEAPTAPQQPTQAIELYTAMLQTTASIQARLDNMQQQIDNQQRAGAGRVTLFVVGVLIGLLVAVLIVGVLWALYRSPQAPIELGIALPQIRLLWYPS